MKSPCSLKVLLPGYNRLIPSFNLPPGNPSFQLLRVDNSILGNPWFENFTARSPWLRPGFLSESGPAVNSY